MVFLLNSCVTRQVEKTEESASDPVLAMANLELEIECDRSWISVPSRLESEVKYSVTPGEDSFETRAFSARVRRLIVDAKEGFPEVTLGGDDFSIIAEGNVRTRGRAGAMTVEEGPFRTLILRNGKMLKR